MRVYPETTTHIKQIWALAAGKVKIIGAPYKMALYKAIDPIFGISPIDTNLND
jgi:hypothetical protein